MSGAQHLSMLKSRPARKPALRPPTPKLVSKTCGFFKTRHPFATKSGFHEGFLMVSEAFRALILFILQFRLLRTRAIGLSQMRMLRNHKKSRPQVLKPCYIRPSRLTLDAPNLIPTGMRDLEHMKAAQHSATATPGSPAALRPSSRRL